MRETVPPEPNDRTASEPSVGGTPGNATGDATRDATGHAGGHDEPHYRLSSSKAGSLTGTATVPGDKSISHRAIMFGGLATGETHIEGLLTGEDVLRTAAAFRALGADVQQDPENAGSWRVRGVGLGGLQEPDDVLDMGNSGTAARLLLGILAGHDLTAFMTGDASLRSRPMKRVMAPLTEMGAQFSTRSGGRLPLSVTGRAETVPIAYTLPVASAQVKSAILLAGLTARGATQVIEPEATRDHTERMLRHFGAKVFVTPNRDGGNEITVPGQPELIAPTDPIKVPSDPSSAAFPIVAATLCEGSDITLPGVGLNHTRVGLIETLRDMGASIEISDEREEGGEPVGDIRVRAAPLTGIDVPPDRAPRMIDEYPILAVAAAAASGTTRMTGVAELRVKETDRLAAVAALLRANGVEVAEGDDWMEVTGRGNAQGFASVPGGGLVNTELDHRIAMSGLVLGMIADAPVTIDDGRPIATSFPNFTEMMNAMGAKLAPAA